MSDHDAPASGTRDFDRVPIETRVDLDFQSFQGFLTEYSSNISLGGMFVNSADPPPPGTMLTFNLRLADDFDLVQGFGQVMWIRPENEGPGMPAGMGVRFLELEGKSVELIQRIIDQRRAEGEETFDLNAPQGEAASIQNLVELPIGDEGLAEEDDYGAGEAIPWPPPPDEPDPDSTLSPLAPELSPTGELYLDDLEASFATPDPEPPSPEPPPLEPSAPALGDPLPPVTEFSTSEPAREGLQSPPDQWPPKVPPAKADEGGTGTGTLTWSGTGTGTASVPINLDEGLMEEIFVPPEVTREVVTERPSARPRSSRAKLSVPMVVLMIFSAFAGALAYRYHESLVSFFGGFDSAADERQVYDVPPPATLESTARSGQDLEPSSQSGSLQPGSPQAARPESGAQQTGNPALADAAPRAGATEDAASAGGEEDPTRLAPLSPDAPRLEQIRLITWKRQPEQNATVVTLWGNGQLRPEDFTHIRLDGRPPRELLKIRGINWPFRDPILDADTSELRRIRTGFHPKMTGNELHIVLDLEDPRIRLSRVAREDNKILLILSP